MGVLIGSKLSSLANLHEQSDEIYLLENVQELKMRTHFLVIRMFYCHIQKNQRLPRRGSTNCAFFRLRPTTYTTLLGLSQPPLPKLHHVVTKDYNNIQTLTNQLGHNGTLHL
jgi:hypothetical protein